MKKKAKKQSKKPQATSIHLDIDPTEFKKDCRTRDLAYTEAMSQAAKGLAGSGLFAELGGAAFMLRVALQPLLEVEERIVALELYVQNGRVESQGDLLLERTQYVKMRQQLEEELGDQFNASYAQAKQSHNKCARTNLDNNDGHLFDYVLPTFYSDGSHDPVGPRDFPWNQSFK